MTDRERMVIAVKRIQASHLDWLEKPIPSNYDRYKDVVFAHRDRLIQAALAYLSFTSPDQDLDDDD